MWIRLKPAVLKALRVELIIIWVFLILLQSATFIYSVAKVKPQYSDLPPQIFAANILKYDKQGLYNLNVQLRHQTSYLAGERTRLLPFRNLPAVAGIFTPLTAFNIHTAYAIVGVINGLLLLAVLILFKVNIPWYQKLALAITLPAVENALVLGQVNMIILLGFVAIWELTKKNQYFLAGLTTFLFFMKPSFLITIPILWFVFCRNKKFLVGAIVAVVAGIAVNAVIMGGFDFIRQYLAFVASTENEAYGTRSAQLYSLAGFFSYIKFPTELVGNVIKLATNYGGLALALFVIDKNRGRFTQKGLFALVIFLTLLFGIHMQGQDASIVLLLVLWAVEGGLKVRNVVFLIIAYLLELKALVPGMFPTMVTLLLFIFMLSAPKKHFLV